MQQGSDTNPAICRHKRSFSEPVGMNSLAQKSELDLRTLANLAYEEFYDSSESLGTDKSNEPSFYVRSPTERAEFDGISNAGAPSNSSPPTYVDGIRRKLLGKPKSKPPILDPIYSDSFLRRGCSPPASPNHEKKKRHRLTLHQCGEALDWFNAVAAVIHERLPETLNNINATVYNVEALLTRLNRLAEQNMPAAVDSVREAADRIGEVATNPDASEILAQTNRVLTAGQNAVPSLRVWTAQLAILLVALLGLSVIPGILSTNHLHSTIESALLLSYNILTVVIMLIVTAVVYRLVRIFNDWQ